MPPFHVAATGHSLNYLPEYMAARLGFFAAEDIDYSASVPKPWDLVLSRLADGSAAAALGGIWVPSMYAGRGREYTAFAQVSNRCPLALVKRNPTTQANGHTPFSLSEVVGRTVLMRSGNGASVGLFFKMLLREAGIDTASVDYVQDLEGAMLAELFQGGMGDYFLTDIISARAMASTNKGMSVAFEAVVDGGDIPWSVYYRETEGITDEVRDVQRRFCVALTRAMEWLAAHEAEEFRDHLEALFPALPIDIVVQVADLYRENNMWTTPVVSQGGFERWQRGIADGRLTRGPFGYADIVDDRQAVAATRS